MKIHECDDSNESYCVVLLCGAVIVLNKVVPSVQSTFTNFDQTGENRNSKVKGINCFVVRYLMLPLNRPSYC